jgi:hypothetical protein
MGAKLTSETSFVEGMGGNAGLLISESWIRATAGVGLEPKNLMKIGEGLE